MSFWKNEILQIDGKHLEIILSVGLQSLRIELQILKVWSVEADHFVKALHCALLPRVSQFLRSLTRFKNIFVAEN